MKKDKKDKKDKKNKNNKNTNNMQGGFPPQQGGYPPPQQGGYPPPQQGGYPPQQGGYPPPQGGFPPFGYPPQQGGFPPFGYPPQQGGFPPQQGGYPPQQGGYPPQQQQQGGGGTPLTFEAYQSRFQSVGQNPEEVVKIFVEGMAIYEKDSELGEQIMCLCRSKADLTEDPSKPSGFKFRLQDATLRRLADVNIARSLVGGQHTTSYQINWNNLNVVLDKGYSSKTQGIGFGGQGCAKFFVQCGGADRPRPIALKCNNSGVWKVVEFSSLTVGVRPDPKIAGDF